MRRLVAPLALGAALLVATSAAAALRPIQAMQRMISLTEDKGLRTLRLRELVNVAIGLVLFAHGSGSSRHSPRNQHVAAALRSSGFATLLLDLLTIGEEADRKNVFDIMTVFATRVADSTRLTPPHGLAHGKFHGGVTRTTPSGLAHTPTGGRQCA